MLPINLGHTERCLVYPKNFIPPAHVKILLLGNLFLTFSYAFTFSFIHLLELCLMSFFVFVFVLVWFFCLFQFS